MDYFELKKTQAKTLEAILLDLAKPEEKPKLLRMFNKMDEVIEDLDKKFYENYLEWRYSPPPHQKIKLAGENTMTTLTSRDIDGRYLKELKNRTREDIKEDLEQKRQYSLRQNFHPWFRMNIDVVLFNRGEIPDDVFEKLNKVKVDHNGHGGIAVPLVLAQDIIEINAKNCATTYLCSYYSGADKQCCNGEEIICDRIISVDDNQVITREFGTIDDFVYDND